MLLLAACGSRGKPPEVGVELAVAANGVEWTPSIELHAPVLEIDAQGRVSIDGEPYVVAEDDAGVAYRRRLTEIGRQLRFDPEEPGMGVAGSAAHPLILLVDARAPFEKVDRALQVTRYNGIEVIHLAVGVRDAHGDLRWFPGYQALDIGISCGPDVREATNIQWFPGEASAPLLLEWPLAWYPGTGKGPKETRAHPVAKGAELKDVLRTWHDAVELGALTIVEPEGVLWSDYIQLLDWCAELGIDGVAPIYFR